MNCVYVSDSFSDSIEPFLSIIGYKRKKGHQCRGEGVVAKWDDGTDAKGGIIDGYKNCMNICNGHRECVGFTHYPTYTKGEIRGFEDRSASGVKFYKKRDFCVLKTSITPIGDENLDCYEKTKGFR